MTGQVDFHDLFGVKKNTSLDEFNRKKNSQSFNKSTTFLFLCTFVFGLAVYHSVAYGASKDSVEKSVYGEMPDGAAIDQFTLTNANGLEVKAITYGAMIISVKTPDRNKKFENITLCLDSFDDYLKGHPLFGSVVGRFANRIADAKFPLDGKEIQITPNAGKNHIHGGGTGFQKQVWNASIVSDPKRNAVDLTHTSPDGHEGYPGKLDVRVRYELTGDDELVMEYTATTDKPTVLNLTNHAYWNLAGAGSGDVLDHVLLLNAGQYLPTNRQTIPTGEIRPVKGTVMDFTKEMTIGSRIDRVPGQNYDHCYVVNKKSGKPLSFFARVYEPKSGRVMEVFTTQPGVQIYTAKHLSDRYKAGGKAYGPYHGLCLETQNYPDAPNHSNFPSAVLRPGETYKHKTIHKFSVKP